jgi:hypothetical protein
MPALRLRTGDIGQVSVVGFAGQFVGAMEVGGGEPPWALGDLRVSVLAGSKILSDHLGERRIGQLMALQPVQQ